MAQVGEIRTNPNNPNQKARWNGSEWEDASQASSPASAPEWGPGAVRLPNGSIARYGPRGGMEILQAAAGGPGGDLKEYQVKAGSQAVLMDQAMEDYEEARKAGYDPAGLRNQLAGGLEGILGGVGPFLADVVRDNVSERGRAAELQYTEGALRALTGAAATDPETRRTARNMFRQPGESLGVEENKARVRDRFARAIQTAAGGAYQPAPSPASRAPIQSRIRPEGLTKAQLSTAQRFKGTRGDSGTQQNPSIPTNAQQFNALPNGTYFIDPQGMIRRKP